MTYLSNFNLRRTLYFLMGGHVLYLGYESSDKMYLLLGGILLLQAIFNATCIGGACARPTKQ